jgi:RING/Ubox like zinc-binding domain
MSAFLTIIMLQICRFCWHRIRTDENGLCPACRRAYSENPANFRPLTTTEVQRLKSEKRTREQQRKQKVIESRQHLAAVRVVQKNLVFVLGLPARLTDTEVRSCPLDYLHYDNINFFVLRRVGSQKARILWEIRAHTKSGDKPEYLLCWHSGDKG